MVRLLCMRAALAAVTAMAMLGAAPAGAVSVFLGEELNPANNQNPTIFSGAELDNFGIIELGPELDELNNGRFQPAAASDTLFIGQTNLN
ncbi:MAG: hypothetical protein AAFR52_19990 [Pseudomonadota bacterium]